MMPKPDDDLPPGVVSAADMALPEEEKPRLPVPSVPEHTAPITRSRLAQNKVPALGAAAGADDVGDDMGWSSAWSATAYHRRLWLW